MRYSKGRGGGYFFSDINVNYLFFFSFLCGKISFQFEIRRSLIVKFRVEFIRLNNLLVIVNTPKRMPCLIHNNHCRYFYACFKNGHLQNKHNPLILKQTWPCFIKKVYNGLSSEFGNLFYKV